MATPVARANLVAPSGGGTQARSLRALAATVIFALLYVAVTATPAAAHATLVDADPVDGEVLAEAPEELTLEFSETVDPDSTQIVVNNAAEEDIVSEPPTFDDRTIVQPVTISEPGEYTLGFQLVSADGHPVDGTLTFTVESVSGVDAGPADDEADSEPDAGDEAGWTLAGVVLLGLLGLLLAAAVVGVGSALLLRRRSSR